MADRVVVTATGIITALGSSEKEHLDAFRDRRIGLHHPLHLQSKHSQELSIGAVNLSNDELSHLSGIAIGDNGYTRTALLTIVAMRQLLSGIDLSIFTSGEFAFINANTVGGMSKMEEIYTNLISPNTEPAFLKYVQTLDCAQSTEIAAKHFGLDPFMATISTACSSSASAVMMGARLIKNGIVKRAICGGSDALSRFTLNGFYSLKNVDKYPCKPFDQNRQGLNLGEAAGYCLLEAESEAKKRGAEIIAVLSGYANTNDAYHPTAPSPTGEGALRTMQLALETANLQVSDIQYINAHGTATQNNDIAEGRAIERLFGVKQAFSSTKPFTGHTLAAAGIIESIFSIWAMRNEILIPNLNFETKMEELNLTPVTHYKENIPVSNVLSNSFGFGGSNVSLIFSKP